MANPKHIIVIGAGICGLSSAIWLRRAGHDVTLIDREGPAAGASYGNAGLLAQWAMIPVNTPGIAKSGLKYMMDRNAPLFMQWSYFPRLIPWLLKFVSNATDEGVRRTVDALMPMIGDSVEQHQALTRGTPAAQWIETSDFTYAYADRAAFDAERYGWKIRSDVGYPPELIEGAAVREAEPLVGPNINLLARIKGHGHITNPGAYCEALATVLASEGGTFRCATVQDFGMTDGRVTSVITDQGAMPCDHAVLAAGIWSKDLMKNLGLKVPLETERGYHLHLKNPSQMPKTPMMMVKGKFGVNPMETGLRCAGTVELGSHLAPPSKAPLELIRKNITWAFPDLRYDEAEEWMGMRPSTPDSLPLVGEIGRTGVFAAFGHQHIGLTAGPKTGRWVADLISDKRPNVDLSPYEAGRFG
jgi:D-amino-acid dehydrogenase